MNTETLSQARREGKIIREQMTERVADILNHPGRYRWMSTTGDLLELTHQAYITGTLTDGAGFQLPFATLAQRVFQGVGLRPVSNPYTRARRAEERKGRRSPTLTSRAMAALSQDRLPQLWDRLLPAMSISEL